MVKPTPPLPPKAVEPALNRVWSSETNPDWQVNPHQSQAGLQTVPAPTMTSRESLERVIHSSPGDEVSAEHAALQAQPVVPGQGEEIAMTVDAAGSRYQLKRPKGVVVGVNPAHMNWPMMELCLLKL
jgi:hypothetical protein